MGWLLNEMGVVLATEFHSSCKMALTWFFFNRLAM